MIESRWFRRVRSGTVSCAPDSSNDTQPRRLVAAGADRPGSPRPCSRIHTCSAGRVAVAHAGGNVDQQRAAEVGIFFELLDVEAILLGPDLPIDIPRVVAPGVFAMLAELDRLAENTGCGASPTEKPSTTCRARRPRCCDPLDRFRMQKSSGIGHRASTRLLGPG